MDISPQTFFNLQSKENHTDTDAQPTIFEAAHQAMRNSLSSFRSAVSSSSKSTNNENLVQIQSVPRVETYYGHPYSPTRAEQRIADVSNLPVFTLDTKLTRNVQEMLEKSPDIIAKRGNGLRVLSACGLFLSMGLNVFYVIRNYWNHERNPDEHLNWTESTVLWIEAIVVVAGIPLGLLTGYFWSLNTGTEIFKNMLQFSTLQTIKWFNFANLVDMQEDSGDKANSVITSMTQHQERLLKERDQRERDLNVNYDETVTRTQFEEFTQYVSSCKSSCILWFYSYSLPYANYISIVLFILYVGVCIALSSMTIMVKISKLSFVGHLSFMEWNSGHMIDFFGFLQQFANVCRLGNIKILIALKIIFFNDDGDYALTDLKRQACFQIQLPWHFIEKFGWIKGYFYLYMTLDFKDLHQLFFIKVDKSARPSHASALLEIQEIRDVAGAGSELENIQDETALEILNYPDNSV